MKDLKGMTFGRLYVIERAESDERGNALWRCKCNCSDNSVVLVNGSNLRRGITKSCGCYRKELVAERNKKYNTYQECKEYYIGSDYNGNTFIIDKDDFEKIKPWAWYVWSNGYVCGKVNGKLVKQHRFIVDAKDNDVVDHKDHNTTNNSKSNLRLTTKIRNGQNKIRRKDNSSTVPGVRFDDRTNKWNAQITINRKMTYLGQYVNKQDAIVARKKAEEEYFGEFSFDNSIKSSLSVGD